MKFKELGNRIATEFRQDYITRFSMFLNIYQQILWKYGVLDRQLTYSHVVSYIIKYYQVNIINYYVIIMT